MGIHRAGKQHQRGEGQPFHLHHCRNLLLPVDCRPAADTRRGVRRIRPLRADPDLPVRGGAVPEERESCQQLGIHHAGTAVHRPAFLTDQRPGLPAERTGTDNLRLPAASERLRLPVDE